MQKKIKQLVLVFMASALLVGMNGGATQATSLLDLTIDRLQTRIEKLKERKALRQDRIEAFKEKIAQAKTKAEERRLEREQRKEEAEQKKLEIQQKIEEKKLEWKESVEAKVAERRVERKEKLSEKKQKLCESVVGKINTIINETDTRRDATYALITQVLKAVKEYYETRELVIENYEVLEAAVKTSQAAAQIGIKRLDSAANFNCDTTEPYGYLAQFRANRSESLEMLKIYRDSVKDLVTAVKTAAKANIEALKGSRQ